MGGSLGDMGECTCTCACDVGAVDEVTDGLEHGCARVAHCVTARGRNFSHYCRPLRQYDVF